MVQSPLIIGITGSIGSGKSAVGALLAKRGALVIDADQLAREVVVPGSVGLDEVVAHFGEEVVDSQSGALDRKKLAQIVFANPEERKSLEAILHPKIRALFVEKLTAATQTPAPPWLIAYLVPLLFESGYSYDELAFTVVVSAPEQQCIERVVARDGISPALVQQRLAAQLPIKEKEKRADFVVANEGSPAALESRVDLLVQELKARYKARNKTIHRQNT